MEPEKLGRKERRRRDRVVKAANRYHDQLILAFLRIIQRENSTDSEIVNLAFKNGDKQWRKYCDGNLENSFTMFSDSALKQIKGIEAYAKKLIPKDESKEHQTGGDQGSDKPDQENKPGEGSGQEASASNS